MDVVRIAANLYTAGRGDHGAADQHRASMLAANPDLQQRLRTERDLIPNFIEECLRLESPVGGKTSGWR